MKNAPEYTEVTFENAEEVEKQLEKVGGYVLILSNSSSSQTTLATSISLYSHARIRIKREGRKQMSIGRVGDEWRNDRSYLLRQIPEPTGDASWDMARSLFEKMNISNQFEFKIGPESCLCRIFYLDSPVQYYPKMILYIPRMECMKSAFEAIIQRTISDIQFGLKELRNPFEFEKDSRKKIIDYIMQDLEDSKVFTRNVSAGQEADTLTGF